MDNRDRLEDCPNCQGKQQLIESKGIEVGTISHKQIRDRLFWKIDKLIFSLPPQVAHTFLLGDKYSSALGARYMGLDNKPHNMFMGCYGIGVSRLMAACLETLSTETELRWPQVLATMLLMLILQSYKEL